MVSNSIDPEMSSSEVPRSQIENESLLKNILNSIPMGIVIIDPVTHLIVDANMAASSMTGSQREELVGSICHRHICPASVGKCPITDLNQKVDLSERILLTSSGKEIPILKNVDMISIQGKNYLLESFVDISDHKRTEEALRISEARYRTLFENSAVPILIIENDTTISLVNAETERLFGYLARDEIGKSWTKFVYKDDLEMMKRYHTLRRTSPSSTPNNYEFRIIDGYGNIRYVLMTIAMLPGSKQSIASLLDITEKKRAQEVLMKSEERYRDLFEGASDLIFSVGSDGELLYANHAWKNALGYADTGIKDIKFCDTVPEDRVESLSGIFKRLSSGESGEEIGLVEAAFRAKNGRKILVEGCVSSKFLDGKMANAMGIFRNITERKNAEDVLGKAMEDLLRSNKELEQFAYIISHDLQEPLRMVTSFLGLISRKYKGKLDKDADEYIAFAVDGTTRMQNMILDLLAYSRVGTRGKPFERIDANIVFQDARDNLMLALQNSGALLTSDPLPTILGDPIQLLQLFQNLIGNAIKFRSKDRVPTIHVSAEHRECEWLFSVSDNGIGIDPEYFERIFMIFQRLHGRAEYPGTGIGLAICKKIVERHGGIIWVDSFPGHGTAFHFTIREENGE